MKILLVNDYGVMLGGAEQYFFMLARQLQGRGHEVTTVSSDHVRDAKRLESTYQITQSGHCFNLDSLGSPRAFWQMRRLVSELKPDVVHFQNVFYALSPSVLFACRNVKTILTLHDYFSICLGDKSLPEAKVCALPLSKCKHCTAQCKKPHFEKIRRNIAQYGLSRIDTLIAPSEFVAQEYQRNGIKNIKVLRHPVPQIISEVRSSDKTKQCLLVVGRLARQKGVSVAISALAIAQEANPLLVLSIVGDGPERKSLEALARELAVAKSVTFHGWCDKNELDKIYRTSGILLQPAIWPEVAGLTVLEAAAYGIPAIVSNIGALPESIGVNNGSCTTPGDPTALAEAILLLMQDTNEYQNYSRRAFEFACSLDVETHINRLEEFYSD